MGSFNFSRLKQSDYIKRVVWMLHDSTVTLTLPLRYIYLWCVEWFFTRTRVRSPINTMDWTIYFLTSIHPSSFAYMKSCYSGSRRTRHPLTQWDSTLWDPSVTPEGSHTPKYSHMENIISPIGSGCTPGLGWTTDIKRNNNNNLRTCTLFLTYTMRGYDIPYYMCSPSRSRSFTHSCFLC